MNKNLSTLTILLSLTVFCSQIFADEVTIVSDRWYPYNSIPRSPLPGYGIEIARYSLEKGGHKLKYQLMSWERSLELVQKGEKNCVIGAYKSEAPGFIFPELSIGADQSIFVRRKEVDWHYDGPSSLENIRLGVIDGYEYSDDITEFLQHTRKPENLSQTRGKFALEFNLSALINNKLDAVVDSKIVLMSAIKKHGWEGQLVFAGSAEALSKVYIACSPSLASSGEYTQLITDGIKELRATGKLKAILSKYNVEDWHLQPAIDN